MRKLHILSATLTLGLLGLSTAQASGFALIEQSASGQGLSYAGAAVNTEDASVMWFNPAGLAEIEGSQLIVGAHVISPSAQFKNNGSHYKNSTLLINGPNDNGARLGVIPNFYWKGQAGDYALGLGINVPYGSTVDYNGNWVGRYHAVKTETKTYNLNPSIARKFGEHLSLGMGLNAQYIDVTLTKKIDVGALLNNPQGADGLVELNANTISFGYNLGAIYDFNTAGKLGISYRSQMDHKANGKAKFSDINPAAQGSPRLQNSNITSNVALPATASFSYAYPVNPKIEVLAGATWTGWSTFKELRIKFDNGAPDSVQKEDWKDVMRYSLGMKYQLSEAWKLRTGVAYDQTPIKNKYLRTPRIADSDRTWLSFGAGYQMSKSLNLDLAYTHIFSDNPQIDNIDGQGGSHVLKGQFDINIDIVSAQLVWKY